jgi:hypothetical protein
MKKCIEAAVREKSVYRVVSFYDLDKFVIDDEQAKVVRDIFR